MALIIISFNIDLKCKYTNMILSKHVVRISEISSVRLFGSKMLG